MTLEKSKSQLPGQAGDSRAQCRLCIARATSILFSVIALYIFCVRKSSRRVYAATNSAFALLWLLDSARSLVTRSLLLFPWLALAFWVCFGAGRAWPGPVVPPAAAPPGARFGLAPCAGRAVFGFCLGPSHLLLSREQDRLKGDTAAWR